MSPLVRPRPLSLCIRSAPRPLRRSRGVSEAREPASTSWVGECTGSGARRAGYRKGGADERDPHLVGIDVSARSLKVAVDDGRQEKQSLDCLDTQSGHRCLVRRLTKSGRSARVVREAKGIYSLDLALALHRAPRIEVMVANPRAPRDFVKAFMLRSKTDNLDASALLELVRRMPFVSWRPPRQTAFALRAFSRRIAALIKIRTQERNRLHAAEHSRESPAAIRRDIEVNLRHLDRRINR
ncbi:MAG TPA: transposase, partial [Thermoanaerobaculia bacterium]|nr:transposase [Thermoanaerobaculia bacterium]